MTKRRQWEIVEPNPDALVESLRAFGYTPETAIADLVDNSVTSGAKHIDISFDWNGGKSSIRVTDDGTGMDELTLVNAMRAGSRNPTEARDPDDLGRFGLGLKTASFSQCRSLTVITTTGSGVHFRRWDLDTVADTREWRLLNSPTGLGRSIIGGVTPLEHGTIVLWEKLDRLVDLAAENDDPIAQKHFLDVAESVEQHLSMTFHRFMTLGRIVMTVNGGPLPRWDPFLEGNVACQRLNEEKLPFARGYVTVRPYVLPHRSKLAEPDFTRAGGKRGWNDLQGFYVYRGDRLLVAGDWLGLGFTKEEHYKLARIAVEIPNDTDDAWQLDVLKSTVTPPAELREGLKRVAKFTRDRAVKVYRHQGKKIVRMSARGIRPLWKQKVSGGRISYTINRTHPLVVSALENPTKATVKNLLRLVESAIPVPLIMIDAAERVEKQAMPLEGVSLKTINALAVDIYRSLRQKGKSHSKAVEAVLVTEPFNLRPELSEMLDALEGK